MAKEHQGFERARLLLRIWARSVICDFAVGFSNQDGRLHVKKLGSRAPWPGVAVFSHGDSSSLRLVQVTVFFVFFFFFFFFSESAGCRGFGLGP